jgi:uncharacterized protein YjbI with pentapeptide repeats
MADQSHLDILQQGREAWNSWRERNPSIQPDLSGANLYMVNLSGAELLAANLIGANLTGANLTGANLAQANSSFAQLVGAYLTRANFFKADLTGADFSRANLWEANLAETNLMGVRFNGADLTGANLVGANLLTASLLEAKLIGAYLSGANLSGADFTRADLSNANLRGSALTHTSLKEATLTGCTIYGISAWSLELEGAIQNDLNISPENEPVVTVDNLEVAQFIYLLLNNEKIRQVIDTITSKAVLILGRFTADRKRVLDAIRDELRQRGYLPILFDFEKPTGRDLTETISTLAHMARFIIADITEAKSIPHELQTIVPDLPSVPVQPLLLKSDPEYGMFEHIRRYPWVLDTYYYDNLDDVLASVEEKVISPAETKARELSS